MNVAASRFDFSALLASAGCDTFFAQYWQRRFLSFRLTEDGFERVRRETGPLDIVRFAKIARGGVQAWIANAQVAHSVLPVDAATAAKAASIGATLYFIDVPLGGLALGLAAFLGARPQNVTASLFFTPAGGGAAWHFDGNENFTVQLTGEKRWSIVEEPAVEGAPESYVLGLRPPGAVAGLLRAVKTEPATTVDMAAGAFLYVPRGMLHRTEAAAASWSLNLSYGNATWFDLLFGALRDRLMAAPAWRGSVAGLGDACNPGARQANALPHLLRDLQALLQDPEEVSRLCSDFMRRSDPEM